MNPSKNNDAINNDNPKNKLLFGLFELFFDDELLEIVKTETPIVINSAIKYLILE